jgi:hypothetical protein
LRIRLVKQVTSFKGPKIARIKNRIHFIIIDRMGFRQRRVERGEGGMEDGG